MTEREALMGLCDAFDNYMAVLAASREAVVRVYYTPSGIQVDQIYYDLDEWEFDKR